MIGGAGARWIVALTVLLCLLGMYVASGLTAKATPTPGQAARAGGWLDSVCGEIDEHGKDGCSAVIGSGYGRLNLLPIPFTAQQPDGTTLTQWRLHPVPVSIVAWCYYATLVLWFLFNGSPTWGTHRRHLVPLFLSLIGVGASLRYIAIMAFDLEQWCPLCMGLHVIDFLICAAMFLIWPRRRPRSGPSETDALPTAPRSSPALPMRLPLATLACAAILTGGRMWSYLQSEQVRNVQQVVENYKLQRQQLYENLDLLIPAYFGSEAEVLPQRDGLARHGPEDGTVDIVLFSDLQCPHCRLFEVAYRQKYAPLFGNQAKLTFRHYPLCASCNPRQSSPSRPQGLHPLACDAAYAVEAARMQQGVPGFWAMHDLLLVEQVRMNSLEFADTGFTEAARKLGLDVERFAADMRSDGVKGIVRQDVETAWALAIRSTPTVFVNGRRLDSIQRGSDAFWTALAHRLVGAGPGPANAAP